MRLTIGFLLLSLVPVFCDQIPKTASESLAGDSVTLPDSIRGHVSVVIVGFSKSSQDAVKAWDVAARKQLGATDVYQVAVLEDAPSFVRGMIKHAMKGSTPADRQGHFLVVVKGEAELKKAAGFAEANDPYVLLLDGSGEIRWRTHGAVSDAALKELADKVQGLK
jgi:predicted transcriptional regulator